MDPLEVKEFSFTDTNDIAAVVQSACDNSDVLYIPTDNTAASNTETIANIVLPANKPVVTGEEGLARGCGVATLSIDYYELGGVKPNPRADLVYEGIKICKEHDIPAIVAFGRKGGSNVAASICNALLYSAVDMVDPMKRGWQK